MIDWTLFFEVFDFTAVAYAVASGIIFGAGPLLFVTLRYPPRIPMSTKLLVLIITLSAAGAGTLFFAGQIVQAITTDPSWPRALGRAALWEVFSLSIGVGLGITRSFASHTQSLREKKFAQRFGRKD